MRRFFQTFGLPWLLLLAYSLQAEIPEEIRVQFRGIKRILEQADAAYYEEHRSIMSDEAYEFFRSHHDGLIAAYPELERQAAGLFVVDTRQKVAHRKPVLSLRKAYSDEEIRRFCDRVGDETVFLLEPKIDGASLVVEYRKGRMAEALTRGNSLAGLDVTTVLLASGALPLTLSDAPEVLRLRGEVYVPRDAFERLNAERAAAGAEPFRSARNVASGTLMLKHYAEVRNRGLKVLFFEVRNAVDLGFESDASALEAVRRLGLPVVDFKTFTQVEALQRWIHLEHGNRINLPYETDGFVLKVDDLKLRETLGNTKKFPRWAIARKFRSEPVVTRVLAIEYSVSELGKRTPIAILSPVEIGGATVQRATLHSASVLESLGIEVGSRVQVIRAGGVVPEIVGVVQD
jgi:DNA ligase (NAD+)